MKSQEELKEYPFSLSWMEGTIGGSLLDDLRYIAKCDTLHDGDFVFKMVEELGANLEELGIDDMKPDHTFIAYHVAGDYEYILLPDEISGFAWIPIWN